jgi:hypothetical protein
MSMTKQHDDRLSLTIRVGGIVIGTAKLIEKSWEIESAKDDDWVIYRQYLTDGIKDLMEHLGIEEYLFD